MDDQLEGDVNLTLVFLIPFLAVVNKLVSKLAPIVSKLN